MAEELTDNPIVLVKGDEENPENIQLRSDDVQEILSQIPAWIVRWGITVIFMIVVSLLFFSWFIKYPEIITSRVTIETATPPVRIIAQTSGKISLFTKDKSTVKKGEYLAMIENPAVIDDIKILIHKLDTINSALSGNIDSLKAIDSLNENLHLGELQNDYSQFVQAIHEYNYFIASNYYQSKISAIQNQYNFYQNLFDKQKNQKEILSRELSISEKKYKNDQKLMSQGAISALELSRSEEEYLQKKYSFQNADIGLVNNSIQLEEYKKTLADLKQQLDEKRRVLVANLQLTYRRLSSSTALWEQRYVIKAPMDGEVSFFKFYSNNQFIQMGDEILTVVPQTKEMIARVYVPIFGSGKIEEGQKVNLKLDNYPFKEFGIVEGKVKNISLVTKDNTYLIDVSLPKGLKTTYKKDLTFKQELSGTAEIITTDLRLFERVFNQLRSLLKSSV